MTLMQAVPFVSQAHNERADGDSIGERVSRRINIPS